METKEHFMSRCIDGLITLGKTKEHASTSCEIAWGRLQKVNSHTRRFTQEEFTRDVNNDGVDLSDAIILAGLAYMWLGDSHEHCSSPIETETESAYDSPASIVAEDYDYSSSSYDSGGSSSSDD